MSLLLISLYELGQFLRILLWITVPLVIVSMLVTTWLHYRRKRRLPEDLEYLLSFEGLEGPEGLLAAAKMIGNGREGHEEESHAPKGEAEEPEYGDKIYKGILWMKEKYERYRDMADKRYEELKEELARAEKKYQDLLESGVKPAGETPKGGEGPAGEPASDADGAVQDRLSELEQASYPDLLEEKNQHIAFLQQQLDNRIKIFHQLELDGRENKSRLLQLEEIQLRTGHLLQEKQAYIDQLEGQLVAERRKIEELVAKLQVSSQQLLAIYQELDRSMNPADTSEEPFNSPSES